MTATDDGLRRYLLGAAGDDDAAAIEEGYFTDPAALDRLDAVEEALIADYLDGQLATAAAAQFERRYLSDPQRRRRVNTLRQLRSAARTAPVVSHGISRQAVLALAASLLIAVGGWW